MSIVKLNNKAVSNATVIGSISSLGSMTFIKKLTASASATLSFVDGTDGVVLDDTYKEYLFTFKNIHSSGNDTSAKFEFNVSIDGGSNYNVAKTTTFFNAYLGEDGADADLGYRGNDDLAQGTGFQRLTNNGNNANDGNLGGTLHLFNPSSTTFVKHFTASINSMHSQPATINSYIAGYANTTSAVNAVQFKFISGNIDAGDICLYGIA
jgi:hypothetical protein